MRNKLSEMVILQERFNDFESKFHAAERWIREVPKHDKRIHNLSDGLNK